MLLLCDYVDVSCSLYVNWVTFPFDDGEGQFRGQKGTI